MKKTLILLTLIILTIIPINSAATDFAFNRLYQDKQPTSGLNDLNDVSIINPFGQQVILYNQTSGDWYNSYINDSAHHVNASDYWITDIGSLSTVNATQFSNNGGVLTAIKSWWDGLYCELTGCTMSGDINMDGNNITNINLLKFDTTICTDTDTLVEGDVCWNEDDHTLNIVTGLNGNVIQVGQEVIGIGINKEGVNLPDGTIVSTSSFQGDRMTFIRADGSNVSKSAMIGILTHDCLNNQECAVTVFGSVRDINTTLFTSGNKLYINQSSPGILTNVIPQLPNNPIWVATAMVIHEQVGTIFVNPSIDPGDGFLINNIWATGDITIQGDLDMTNGSIFNLWELVSTDGSRIATGTNPAYSLFSGLDSAEVFSNNQTVGAGVITHALLSTDLGNEKVIAAWQSGKNNSGAYTRNSMGVFPDLGILNVSILTNIEKMWLNFGIRPLANYFSLENKTSVAALWAFESQKLFLHDDLGNGQLLGEGDFTWVSRDGTDIDLYNGDGVHIKKDVIKQFGFSIGDNITSLNADFDSGVLLPFIQTTGGGIADWLLVSSILCHNQECASSLGGSGSPLRSMQSNFSTIDQNNLNLSWWLTINQAPSDIFTVEVNNNIGSGDVTIFSSSSIFTDEFQSIILPSSMNNVSIVTVIFNFRGNNRIVDVVYVDEILIIGNATTTTFANVTVEDALLSFGDKTCGIELSVEDGYQDLNITCDRINLIGNVTAIDVTEVSINVTNNINIGGNLSIDSLTKGSVLFSGDNGLVTEDNSNLFWDNVNKRLGIGKIPTSHTLDLSQNEDDSGILVRGFDDQSQANLGFSITATGFAKMFSNRNFQLQSRDDMTLKSTEGNIIFAIPSGKQAKWLDSSFQPFMTADETTGNVGIGTSTPKNSLDVSGSQVIGTSYAGVNTAPTNGLIVEGNVGIGTTSPQEKLDVAGNINIANDSAYLYDGVSALRLAKGTDSFYANTFVGEDAGNSIAQRQTAVGYYAGYLNTGDYQTATGYAAGYQNIGAQQTAIGYIAGYDNTGTEQTVTGYSAGNTNTGTKQTAMGYFAGRQNTGTHQTAIGNSAGFQNTGNRVSGFGFEATRNNSGNDVVGIGYRAGKDNVLDNQFIVQQANVNAVPLIQGDFASGNVGIGTASPKNSLDVSGSQVIGTSYAGVNTAPTNGLLVEGNVGIGTDSPQEKLHIDGNILLSPDKSIQMDLTRRLLFDNTNGPTLMGSVDVNFIIDSNNDRTTSKFVWAKNGFTMDTATELMVLNEDGNVGIGTTSPLNKLHIKGADPVLYIQDTESTSGSAKSFIKFSESSAGGGSEATYRIGQDSRKFTIAFDTNDNDGVGDDYADLLTIDDDGNVGIGTASPSYKLEVNGTINAEIILAQNGFTGNCINTSFVSGIAVGCND